MPTRIFKYSTMKPRHDASLRPVAEESRRSPGQKSHKGLAREPWCGQADPIIGGGVQRRKKGRRGGIGKKKEHLVSSSELPDAILHPGAGGAAEIERTSRKRRGCDHGDIELARTAMIQPGEPCPLAVQCQSAGHQGTECLPASSPSSSLPPSSFPILSSHRLTCTYVCRHVSVGMCSRLSAEVSRMRNLRPRESSWNVRANEGRRCWLHPAGQCCERPLACVDLKHA